VIGRRDAAAFGGLGPLVRFAQRTVGPCPLLVYPWCVARTNIDLDEKACASVMRLYRLKTKREAINFALRALAAEPLTVESARKLRGSGWSGDLGAMRTDRAS
jgi:Arc/MetJ family transcription regulator